MKNGDHPVDWHGHYLRIHSLEAGQLYQTPSGMPMTDATVGCGQNKMLSNHEAIDLGCYYWTPKFIWDPDAWMS